MISVFKWIQIESMSSDEGVMFVEHGSFTPLILELLEAREMDVLYFTMG